MLRAEAFFKEFSEVGQKCEKGPVFFPDRARFRANEQIILSVLGQKTGSAEAFVSPLNMLKDALLTTQQTIPILRATAWKSLFFFMNSSGDVSS